MTAEEEKTGPVYPTFSVANSRASLLRENCEDRQRIQTELSEVVKDNRMIPYYETHLVEILGPMDKALKEKMQKDNDEELVKIEEKIADARENFGDIEVRDGLLAKAEFYTRIGDKDAALEGFKVAFEKTVGVGAKLDNILYVIRIGFFFDDVQVMKEGIERAKKELLKGGDWERRNKLKVYEGLFLMVSRDFKSAADLFLNVLPTFTASELVEFKDFVFYTVIVAMVACDRPTIRGQLVSSPEVLSAIDETPYLSDFMNSFFECRYKAFFSAFTHILDHVRAHRYLARHLRYFMRMMRLNAYRQFLASYRSVTLEAMATEFGVSSAFIDAELSSFISSGKLTCKIDKVAGIIQSVESDTRSQVYVEIIKQGDLLLNRMQKLSGAIDM